MARKPKRRRSNWGPILWLLALGNIGAGLWLSPITAAAKVRVVGALPSDQERIRGELQFLKRQPCLRVNRFAVEERALRRPLVREAEYTQNIFRRGRLKVSYYEPVALLENSPNVVLTAHGTLAIASDLPTDLPRLRAFPEATGPILAYAGNWQMKEVADTCIRASTNVAIKDLLVTVASNGQVCLNSSTKGRVILGFPDNLDEKFKALEDILTASPELLSQNKELNLTVPAKPVVRDYSGGPK
ncbi:MAG TPA: hypothetical protein VEX38_03570 [Fimbriimonadaceae bacterium]|nr:hypothetical protein [Fimbriimonadaceae bacterium]